MQRILYLTFNDPYASPGVNRKEREFCARMGSVCAEHGIEFKGVDVFTPEYSNGKSRQDSEFFEHHEVTNWLHRIFMHVRFVRALFRVRPLVDAAYRLIDEYDPDVLIWRYDIINLPGVFYPKRYKRDLVLISEHQTKEPEELALNLIGRIKMPLLRRYEQQFAQTVDAVVGVTSEIATYEVERFRPDLPSHVHTNGINVASCKVADYSDFDGKVLRIIFVGSATAPWHGVDRLLQGLAGYSGDVRVELHMVGVATDETVALVDSLGLNDMVVYHGVQYGADLDAIFNQAHLAVGALGLHRQNLKYGSTLKVREYMARGVPIVISHIDEDIAQDFPLCHIAPADESPLDIERLVEFARSAYSDVGAAIPQIMHRYASENMDYEGKASRLLDFVKEVVGES